MAKVVAAQIAAFRLCLKMADEFENENEYEEAFDSCMADLLEKMEK